MAPPSPLRTLRRARAQPRSLHRSLSHGAVTSKKSRSGSDPSRPSKRDVSPHPRGRARSPLKAEGGSSPAASPAPCLTEGPPAAGASLSV